MSKVLKLQRNQLVNMSKPVQLPFGLLVVTLQVQLQSHLLNLVVPPEPTTLCTLRVTDLPDDRIAPVHERHFLTLVELNHVQAV